MPTNVNEPVWTTGEAVFSGGGAQASVLIPADLDTVVIDLADATTADIVDVEVSQDAEEAISGIVERPLRYADCAVNDLGGSGELRINAGSALDFTDDGWAVGDTFEVLSHRVPDFGPERTHPTTLGDGEIYTVSAVSAKVLAFTEDPGYSLAEGDIVVAQSRTALTDGNVTWFIQGSLDASSDSVTVTLNDMGAKRIRVNQSTGTAAVTWSFKGTRQSRRKDAPFVLSIESRPFAGIATEKAFLPLASVADGAVVTWDEVVTAGPNASRRQARATVAGANFDSDGLQNFDRVFVGGHSPTGNNGLYTVDSRISTAVTFKEPLKGTAGVDTPGRAKFRYLPATISEVLPSDYDELVFADMSDVNGIYYGLNDGLTITPLDQGPTGNLGMVNTAGVENAIEGPWVGSFASQDSSHRYKDSSFSFPAFGAGEQGTFEGWYRFDVLGGTDHFSANSITGGQWFFASTTAGDFRMIFHGEDAPDPGAWAANTIYASGDRRRLIADTGARLHEVETAGTSAAVVAGTQEVDVANLKALATATGLANDATVYTASVSIDGGGGEAISIVGSAAQTYTTLISELETDTTGTWTLVDGNLVCTSPTTGETSTVAITDTDLFLTLTSFVAVNSAVAGDGEPDFDVAGGTELDGALTSGFHDGDYGALLLGATATGLVNDSTVYTAAVTVDGGSSQPIAVTGSTAQTYTTLLAELNTDTTGGTWSLKNGELRCTSDTTGTGSTVAIVDTDLLSTLTDFVSLNTAVPGATVVTWRDLGVRTSFHNLDEVGSSDFVVDTWYHVAVTREAAGHWRAYINGVETLTQLVADDDTTPGSFGSPKQFGLAASYAWNSFNIGDNGTDEDNLNGAWSKVALYDTALTPAQILAHYNKGVELGIL